MTEIIDRDVDDGQFVMVRRHTTVVFTVTSPARGENPVITVATYTKSGKTLLYARSWEILCVRSESDGEEILHLRRVDLRVDGIGRLKKRRAGIGAYGTWKTDRVLWDGLYAAGITDPDHCRGLDWHGNVSAVTPLDARGWKFMRGIHPCICGDPLCVS